MTLDESASSISSDSTTAPTPHNGTRRHRQINQLVQSIKDAADKLLVDGTRGDLKLLSRALRELRYGFKVFGPYRRQRKVTVFGSARTPEEAPAYRQAISLGRSMADEGWMVITGAASGIMEAGHRGAGRQKSMGLNILLPFETDANPVIHGDPKLVNMKYFFTRKVMFVKECDAVVCLPGGFGTMDEAMEVLTLLQTGKRDMVPVVMLDEPGGDYWKAFHDFIKNQLLAKGMIWPEDLGLYRVTDKVEEAVTEVTNFYRVYHSQRLVKDQLVLRLNEPVDDRLLDQINTHFADINHQGGFQLREALPEEADEPDLAELPRLTFNFNRRSLGRLRQLINCLNAGSLEPVNADSR